MGSRRALTLVLLSVLTSAAIFYSGMNFGRGAWIIGEEMMMNCLTEPPDLVVRASTAEQ